MKLTPRFHFPRTEAAKKSEAEDEVEILDDDEDEDDDIGDGVGIAAQPVLLDNPDKLAEPTKLPKAKLLQFHENQRPPYWGTW